MDSHETAHAPAAAVSALAPSAATALAAALAAALATAAAAAPASATALALMMERVLLTESTAASAPCHRSRPLPCIIVSGLSSAVAATTFAPALFATAGLVWSGAIGTYSSSATSTVAAAVSHEKAPTAIETVAPASPRP